MTGPLIAWICVVGVAAGLALIVEIWHAATVHRVPRAPLAVLGFRVCVVAASWFLVGWLAGQLAAQ
jgi:hypothetical protein